MPFYIWGWLFCKIPISHLISKIPISNEVRSQDPNFFHRDPKIPNYTPFRPLLLATCVDPLKNRYYLKGNMFSTLQNLCTSSRIRALSSRICAQVNLNQEVPKTEKNLPKMIFFPQIWRLPGARSFLYEARKLKFNFCGGAAVGGGVLGKEG